MSKREQTLRILKIVVVEGYEGLTEPHLAVQSVGVVEKDDGAMVLDVERLIFAPSIVVGPRHDLGRMQFDRIAFEDTIGHQHGFVML